MANSPAYQFYPADLISDPEVMFWDMEMLGAYWQMLNLLWLNNGYFDSNSPHFFENLRKLFRKKTKKSAQTLWKKIEKKFVVENGVITHKRILKEIQKQSQTRLMRQKAGKKGSRKRWGDDNKTMLLPLTKNNPSSSTSTSYRDTNVSLKENVQKKKSGKFPPTLDEVRQYVKDNPELNNVDPLKFWKAFTDSDPPWHDTRGNPVRNWKLKLRTWSDFRYERNRVSQRQNATGKRQGDQKQRISEQDWGSSEAISTTD